MASSTNLTDSTVRPAASALSAGDSHFRRIGILHHPKKDDSIELAGKIETLLRAAGIDEIWHESAWDADAVLTHLPDVDLLITLGGDGTLLRAARMGASHGVPMLGVKMGRLGFLAEIMPDDWETPLQRIVQGDYWVEERLMVRTRVERRALEGQVPELICEHDALNDVVLSRGDVARVVRISAQLDGATVHRASGARLLQRQRVSH